MSLSNVCRLCFSETNGLHVDLFSEMGIELRMSEIIGEHFKCDVNQADALPKVICQVCWSTTESFHELYLRSRLAQSRFLNSSIKPSYMPDMPVMPNMTGYNHVNIASHSYEKQPIDVCKIQMDSNVGNQIDSHLKPANFVALEIKQMMKKSLESNINSIHTRCECHQKPFASINSYNEHLRSQTQQYICDMCGKSFRTRKTLSQHFTSTHQKKLIFKPEKEPNLLNDLCNETCRRKCSHYITVEDRQVLFSTYYSLDVNGKNNMLFNCIKRRNVKTHRKNITRLKQNSFSYIIELPNKKGSIDVCKKAFCSIFQITMKKIETIQKKRSAGEIVASEDKRGKHSNRANKTTDGAVNEIIKHISSFPVENPRSQKSKKLYLATVLSKSQMHKLYLEHCAANNLPKDYFISYGIYSKIFTTKFKLSFKKPPKQQK